MSTVRSLLLLLTSLLPSPRVILALDGISPYLSRWYLLGRPTMPDGSSPFDATGAPREGAEWSDGYGLYIHRFHQSDLEEELHDHPFAFAISLVLSGSYTEKRLYPNRGIVSRRVTRGDLNVIGPETFHRVELAEGEEAWSVFLVAPKSKSWGFLRPWGTVTPFREFFAERSRARRTMTHCPSCDEPRTITAYRDEQATIRQIEMTTKGDERWLCDPCRMLGGDRKERKRLDSAERVPFGDLGERGLVGKSGRLYLRQDETVEWNLERLREDALVAPDGSRYMWVAPVDRPTVDPENLLEDLLYTQHEDAAEEVDQTLFDEGVAKLRDALKNVRSFLTEEYTAVVALPKPAAVEVSP